MNKKELIKLLSLWEDFYTMCECNQRRNAENRLQEYFDKLSIKYGMKNGNRNISEREAELSRKEYCRSANNR